MQTGNHPLRNLSLVIVLVSVLLTMAMPVTGQTSELIAVVEPQQGLVQVRAKDAPEDEWHTLVEAQLINEGDWLRTDQVGLATLTYFEGMQSDILPDTLVQVTKLALINVDSTDISLAVSVGDMRHQIDRVMDAQSHFEVQTPNAVITVRGTNFWTSATWLTETIVNTLSGTVQVAGKSPEGYPGLPVMVGPNLSVNVYSQGLLGAVAPLQRVPEYPPEAPLAPATCGNGICDPGEDSVCALDCGTFPSCGDKLCDVRAGEGPVTCAADCVPVFRPLVALPCTVQTAQQANPLRIGPGPNRPIRIYMPTNQPFPVKGQAQGDDGAVWWQLDVPNISQAWVLPDNVDASGNCLALPTVEVPPVIILPPPTAIPQAQPTTPPQPTVPAMTISFYADRYEVKPGECVTVGWDVEGVSQVYYQGQGVVGHSSTTECLRQTTTYTLTVITLDGNQVSQQITVNTTQIIG